LPRQSGPASSNIAVNARIARNPFAKLTILQNTALALYIAALPPDAALSEVRGMTE
jgi:hypothetical protein